LGEHQASPENSHQHWQQAQSNSKQRAPVVRKTLSARVIIFDLLLAQSSCRATSNSYSWTSWFELHLQSTTARERSDTTQVIANASPPRVMLEKRASRKEIQVFYARFLQRSNNTRQTRRRWTKTVSSKVQCRTR
jgi:hypothetical protein